MPKQIKFLALYRHIRVHGLHLLITAFVIVTSLTPASEGLPSSLIAKAEAHSPASSRPSPEARQEGRVAKVLLLTVRPTGFEPAEATLTAGEYLTVVQNRSGLRRLTLRLNEDSRGRLLEMSLKARLDWRRRVNLAPGSYTLTEVNNPEWVCRITITQ